VEQRKRMPVFIFCADYLAKLQYHADQFCQVIKGGQQGRHLGGGQGPSEFEK